MAIIVTKENKVIEYNPSGKMSIDEIAGILSINSAALTFNSDIKYCIIASSLDPSSGINSIATLFCENTIYGDALFMTGQELCSEKRTLKHITEQNSLFETKDFNSNIINAFKNAISQINKVYGFNASGITLEENIQTIYLDIDELYSRISNPENDYEELQLQKPQQKKFTLSDYDDVMKRTYEGLLKYNGYVHANDCTLFKGKEYIIKLDPNKAKITIEYLIGYYCDKEEYEKCAYLRDIKILK